MKALKTLVIGMGLLIVFGLCLVGYGLTRSKQQPAPQMQEVRIETRESFKATVPVSPGMKLEQVTTTGDRIVLRFSTPDGGELVLIDSHTGRTVGTILLTPESK